jgi:ankyrin repeat protein
VPGAPARARQCRPTGRRAQGIFGAEWPSTRPNEVVVRAAGKTCWGNIEIIKLFLSKGLEINEASGGGWSPLMTAINEAYSGKVFPNGNDEVIRFLLGNGASVNYQDVKGETALMLAVESDSDSNAEIIRLLIEHGADINLRNSEGETALDKAIDYGNKTAADYLIANGAKGRE